MFDAVVAGAKYHSLELTAHSFLPPPPPRYVTPVAYAAGTANGMPVPILETSNVLKHPEGGCPLQVGEGRLCPPNSGDSFMTIETEKKGNGVFGIGTYELREDLHLATPPPHPTEAPVINPNPLATAATPPTTGVKISLVILKPRQRDSQLYKTNTRSSLASKPRSTNENEYEGRTVGDQLNGNETVVRAPAFGEGTLALTGSNAKDPSGLKRRKPKNNIVKSTSSFISRVIVHEPAVKKLSERSQDGLYVFANINRSFQWLDFASAAKQDPLTKILFTKAHMLCHDVNDLTKSSAHLDIVMGSSAGDIIWYEPMQQKYARINKNGAINDSPVNHIKWIPGSENLFLAAHSDGCLVVYDKEKEDAPFTPEEPDENIPVINEKGEEKPSWSSSNFKILKSVDSKNQRTNPVACWKLSNQKVNSFAFSPDNRHLAVVLDDGTLRIVDYLKEKPLDIYTSYYGNIICVCWSPDGKYILTGGQDDLVSIWSFAERRIVARCQGHNSFVSCVAFDPWRCDERTYRFGSVGDDCRLLLWDFSVAMLHRPKAVQVVTTRHRNSAVATNRVRAESLTASGVRTDSFSPEKPMEKGEECVSHVVEARARTAQLPPILSKVIGVDPICWLGFLEDSIMTSSLEGHIQTWDRPSETANEPNASTTDSSVAIGSEDM
ncbi:hypothetical protein FQN57_002147 [Myotisia sp. PD_48]|nr:hypothetical protein FQN57_002147 [Myotisia sp. PD_48]